MNSKIVWPNGSFENCELIVFDKDGTVVDFSSIWLDIAAARAQKIADQISSNSPELFSWRARFLRALGIHPETGEIDIASPVINLSFEGQCNCLASVLHALQPEKFNWKEALKMTTEANAWALKQCNPADKAKLKEGAKEFILDAQKAGIKLAMVTADYTKHAEDTLKKFDLLQYFDFISGADKYPSKPSGHVLLEAAKQIGVKPENTLTIGDTPKDIEMAKNAGMKVLTLEGLANKEQLFNVGADAVVADWSQISVKPEVNNDASFVDVNNGQKEIGSYILQTDGASRGNPGPAAIGYVLLDEKRKVINKKGETVGICTNNVAEYKALVSGLFEFLKVMNNKSKLQIEMDSELIVKQILGQYKVKDLKMKELYSQVQEALKQIPNWKIVHIRREKNKIADSLCNYALDSL